MNHTIIGVTGKHHCFPRRITSINGLTAQPIIPWTIPSEDMIDPNSNPKSHMYLSFAAPHSRDSSRLNEAEKAASS
jgi:hypothetical protein